LYVKVYKRKKKNRRILGGSTVEKGNLLDKRQVCELLNIKASTLNKLLAQGKIPTIRFNRKVLFDPHDIRQFIQAHKQGGKNEVA